MKNRRRHLPVVVNTRAKTLVDPQQRAIRYLRISLTDRCNYRCTYCMPEQGVPLVAKELILNFEEIARLVRIFVGLGVRRVRLTGGEPTIRKRFLDLVAMLAGSSLLDEVVMTTNGHRLAELAEPLHAAGMTGVNVSLDTLDTEQFARLTRRGDIRRVIAGIDAAVTAGLEVRLNTVVLRGVNNKEIAALCQFAWARGIVPRFIEHMPMSGGSLYRSLNHLPAREIRQQVQDAFGELSEMGAERARGPARYYTDPRGRKFGIISAISEHFCSTCNRVRLSAAGALYTCLADDQATDLRTSLRSGANDEELARHIERAVSAKQVGHNFVASGGGAPQKHMVSIGG